MNKKWTDKEIDNYVNACRKQGIGKPEDDECLRNELKDAQKNVLLRLHPAVYVLLLLLLLFFLSSCTVANPENWNGCAKHHSRTYSPRRG